MTETRDVITALVAEGDEVDRLVASLDATLWSVPTPAPRWTVAHQIAHLAAIFRLATLAAADPDAFTRVTARLGPDFEANVEQALAEYLADPPDVLLSRWRSERSAVAAALRAVPPDRLVPWLVRPIPAAVLAAAGMTELVGHGQDIADALGVERRFTDRIRHVVGFAVRTWDFGYLARGLQPPAVTFRFELTAPSGESWEFGPADSAQRITGPAVDFCLLVTRRRHRADLSLVATGQEADRWLDIAQAYRGSPGEGRQPTRFARSATGTQTR
jgi:enediyne biosynthesis protein E11